MDNQTNWQMNWLGPKSDDLDEAFLIEQLRWYQRHRTLPAQCETGNQQFAIKLFADKIFADNVGDDQTEETEIAEQIAELGGWGTKIR